MGQMYFDCPHLPLSEMRLIAQDLANSDNDPVVLERCTLRSSRVIERFIPGGAGFCPDNMIMKGDK